MDPPPFFSVENITNNQRKPIKIQSQLTFIFCVSVCFRKNYNLLIIELIRVFFFKLALQTHSSTFYVSKKMLFLRITH